ncbi:ClpP/crotonase [Aureobasidium subglaciale]|nr:ClpP/crotonase [Aureobasidium subglaciale]KAI5232478.1 ClpP/crotonase [Aureobasidium subglaciale]KAI5234646.1 ClpP/crotonase [Aureobasidium subglaciale]KAI5268348.1 ClpP/crotonase [Aureobasidium subglaciale]
MPLRLPTRRVSTLFNHTLTKQYRHYSTPHSTLKISQVPAPHAGSIRIISLNRPSARNAISTQLLAELRQQIQEISAEAEDGPTRALILSSESDAAFCAGADLKERLTMSGEQTKQFLTTLRDTFTRLSLLRIPTISAVGSVAFGGGLEVALTTTFRVFGSTASVALPETRLAIIPGAGGTFRLPALIGTARARDMILTGRRVTAAEAYFLGLCDRLVEVGEAQGDKKKERELVLTQAVALARDVCEGGPVATRAALQAVNSWGAGEEAENAAYERVLGTQDRIEALKAFGEKRPPVFKGR